MGGVVDEFTSRLGFRVFFIKEREEANLKVKRRR